MLGNHKLYYIQSKPPDLGLFFHCSLYAHLKKIAKEHFTLKEGKPYSGISLTIHPGRFSSHMPQLPFGGSMDGFIQMDSAPLIGDVIPCLYRTSDEELLEQARKQSFQVFAEENLPPEYKYVLRYVVKNAMFVNENEWLYLGQHLAPPVESNYNVYVKGRYYNRLVASVREYDRRRIHRLEEHPLKTKVKNGM